VRYLGVDEIFLGHRDKFVTVVSDLESGEPLWVGLERKQQTLNVQVPTNGRSGAWDEHRTWHRASVSLRLAASVSATTSAGRSDSPPRLAELLGEGREHGVEADADPLLVLRFASTEC
jgi:Transposase